MEFQKVIEDRRSIRAFKDTEVTDEQISEIIKAGILAPSAKNGQPWRFVVVRNEEVDKICCAMEKFQEENPDMKITVTSTVKFMRNSSATILVFMPRRIGRIAERAPWQYLIPEITSVGACFENMTLKAHDMGLGSLWIANVLFAKDYLEERFGQDIIAGCLSVGYPDECPDPRPRKSFDELVTFVN